MIDHETNGQKYLERCQHKVIKSLKRKLPSIDQEPKVLHEAMTYAVLNGGKRLRAALVYATGEALGAPLSVLDSLAAAVEIVHAFSLVHDDLPAIDNDDLRRGQPTCHRIFGEATAILAGDALQILGLELIININHKQLNDDIKLKMIALMSHSIGSYGLIGGEELDIKMLKKANPTIEDLEFMYKLKTGCLIKASVLLGALAANCQNKKITNNLGKFAENIGLAFQIHDDIIGIESDTKILGKKQGADLALNKPIYPIIAGMNKAKEMQQLYYKKAINHLHTTGIENTKLLNIANYIISRNH